MLQSGPGRSAYYLDVGGQHSEKYWGARFWRPLQFLFPAASPPVHHGVLSPHE